MACLIRLLRNEELGVGIPVEIKKKAKKIRVQLGKLEDRWRFVQPDPTA
jgi:hypothetical protein